MYFLLLKCVFLHFPIVLVVFQIYVWCTFNMYFLFYQYVFDVFPTIFAFPLYLHLFCCSSKIYFTFSTWYFVFTISICVHFVFFCISCMCLCSSTKSLKGTAGGQRRPLTWASKKVSFPTMEWWSQKSFSHRRESYLRMQIMQILLDSNKVSFSSMNKNNSWAMAHTMTWICKLIYLDIWLDLGHLEILYSLPLPERY